MIVVEKRSNFAVKLNKLLKSGTQADFVHNPDIQIDVTQVWTGSFL